jgi:glycerophosphoryl diester phosphodiesterase
LLQNNDSEFALALIRYPASLIEWVRDEFDISFRYRTACTHRSHKQRKRKIMKRLSLLLLSALITLSLFPAYPRTAHAQYRKGKTLVAHRGASAYAPEHTLEAYQLAIEQGADFVEQDLQITKDGVLVCLHDLTLERTTNVEEIFPDRFKSDGANQNIRHWYVSDFTLKEIKQLDAGLWFHEKFRGVRIPTFQEAIDQVRGRAGLFPETKGPEIYGSRGLDMERLLLAVLKKNRLDKPGADPRTPIIIQSFSAESLKKMRSELKIKLPLVLLIGMENQQEWFSAEGLKRVREFAVGIGPAKMLLASNPAIVDQAHALGLSVTPYTFRSAATGRYADVREEMDYFLNTLKVDAVFTDNPDKFPRHQKDIR